MAQSASKESSNAKGAIQSEGHARGPICPTTSEGTEAHVFELQRSAGNQAVNRLLQSRIGDLSHAAGRSQTAETTAAPSDSKRQGAESQAELLHRASAEFGQPLDESVRVRMERALGNDLKNVRVHTGPSADAAADSLGARAYTIGSNIYLGRGAHRASGQEKNVLLAHEAVHTVQQKGQPVALQGKLQVSQPGDSSEVEADRVAESVTTGNVRPGSSALAMRSALRVTPIAPRISRDIRGFHTSRMGKFEIDFTKANATVAGNRAEEDGKVVFTPSKRSPHSTYISFVQIVRTTDTAGTTANKGDPIDWAKVDAGTEAPRNQMLTTANRKQNVAGGFFVDQIAAALAKRTKKADPEVSSFYEKSGGPIPAGTEIGSNDGTAPKRAVLTDNPGSPLPIKWNFVTSAKSDTGTWYGSVLWGFETFVHKKSGITKIKGEYHSFRGERGATTDAAITKYDEFYQNPGTAGAPTT